VRVNPGDEASLKALAKTLADEFQTPEAIELYWRAFEKVLDLESQTQIVVALSNLYLRSNQFRKLIERLELRSRELNLPTEMTRCIATAYREAGDFRKARETLLSAAEGTDTDVGILRQLVQLSLQEQNEVEAIDYQRRIVAQTSGDSERKHLAEMLLAAGQSEEGYRVFESTADATVTDAMLLAEIQLGGSGRNIASVIKACREYLESTPNDWSVLASLATLLQQTNQREEASHLALQVLGMTVAPEAIGSLNTLPVIDARSSSIQRHTNYLTTYHAVPKNTFVAAYCRCADILLLTAGTPHADAMPQIFKAESRARLGDLPLVFIADNLPPTSQAIDLFLNHMKNETESQNLTDDQRLLLQLVVTELRIRFHRIATEDLSHERAEFVRRLPTQVGTHPEFFDRNQILDRVWSIFESDTIATKQLLTALRESLKAVTEDRSRAVVAAIAMAFEDAPLLIAAAETVIPTPMQESEDGFWESLTRIWRLAGLLEKRMITSPLKDSELLATQASLVCRFSKLPSRNLTELLNDASAMGISSWRSILFSESDNVMEHSLFLLSVNEKTGRALTEWADKNLADPDPLFRARAHLLLPSENSNEQAVLHLIQAAEAMPDIPGLRFACALEAARLNLLDEAVQLLDSMQVSDPASKVEIEIKALDWSLAGGNKSRAIVAAETLFGLPLNVDQQKSLAARYSQLGLNGKLSALQARLGRGSETRQSVLAQQLQSYLAQGNNELAGEVAWELLKLASGGTLFSGHRPNDDRDDGGERLQAIKALGKLKRLQPLIDRYEAMLEASPESVDLLEILCEFHEAAAQFPQLAEKRDRIALLSKKAPPSLKAKAVALENSGDVSGACDIYLQILKGDPEAFADEMETYVQAFERAKRHADFLTSVIRLDQNLWSGNAALLINIAAELARAKTNDPVVKECVEAMLANENTRRLAIGGFLARPDVVAEETLLPAIQEELTSEDAFDDLIRCNETFLILQGVKQEASLKSLHEFLTSRRAAGRQPSVSTPPSTLVPSEKESEPEGSPPPLAEMQTDLMLIFLDARLGDRVAVEQRVKELFGDAATNAPSSGLAASVGDSTRQRRENGSPGGEKGGGEVAFGVLVLNTRLKDLGKEWDSVRLALLESLAAKIAAQDAEKQNELADSVLDELGSVYESLGQTQKARSILNQRIQTMLVSTGADNGKASESIRQLLQAGEKIQHSGFPIEGARLLLNVTPHDIDEFTSDLDDDKAIAFKSRFNASQRWARQQITPEKLVTWFEMSVSDLTGDSSGTDPESTDILLEVSGVTDPRTSDKDALQRLTIESLLLNSIRKSEFTDPDLIKRTDAAVSQLVVIEQLNLPLLTVALAFSDRMSLTDRDALNARIDAAANLPVIIPESNPAERKSSRLPEALRSDPDLSCMQTARLLATQADRQPLVTNLLNRSAAAAAHCNSRLLKIAVLNECVAVAKLAGLKDQVSQLKLAAQAAIEVQLQSASPGGIDGDIDLAHEIRTRLLNKK
jgi:tetratricopeptide (TPR) repeat protein